MTRTPDDEALNKQDDLTRHEDMRTETDAAAGHDCVDAGCYEIDEIESYDSDTEERHERESR